MRHVPLADLINAGLLIDRVCEPDDADIPVALGIVASRPGSTPTARDPHQRTRIVEPN